jgi:hypothetical protein
MGKHLPRVREQALAVAIVDDAERIVVPGAEQRDELGVRAKAKKRCPERSPSPGYCCRCWECGRFHVNPFNSNG